jgi:hypothetical protein
MVAAVSSGLVIRLVIGEAHCCLGVGASVPPLCSPGYVRFRYRGRSVVANEGALVARQYSADKGRIVMRLRLVCGPRLSQSGCAARIKSKLISSVERGRDRYQSVTVRVRS